MVSVIRGYSYKGRKVSFWVVLLLSLLSGTTTALSDTTVHALPFFGIGLFSSILLTRLWYVFWPVLGIGLGGQALWIGASARDYWYVYYGACLILLSVQAARAERGEA